MSKIETLSNNKPKDFEKYEILKDKINELVEIVNLLEAQLTLQKGESDE